MNGSTEKTRWTPEIVKRAQALKNEGLSFAKIGKRLGVSKNSILSAYKRHVEGHDLNAYVPQGYDPFAPRGPVPTLAFVRGLEKNPRYTMEAGR